MSSVLWHIVMSLDGFIARPNDDMAWVWEHAGPSGFIAEIVRTTGALVVGRRTYEVEDRDRPGFYGGAWKGPFFVVTHRVPTIVPEWMTGTFVTEGVQAAVRRAKAAAGDKNVVILGGHFSARASH